MTVPLSQSKPQPPLMTVAELCDQFQIGRKTAYEMAHGPLAHTVVRVGAKQTGIRFIREGVRLWLEGQGGAEKGR